MSCFPTPGFQYRQGELYVDDVPLRRIAELAGTPTYVYSATALRANWQSYADAFAGLGISICYALKANSNLAVVRLLAGLGAGADVVSAGEMQRALAAGIPANRIVFSGVGKTRDELTAALLAGIHQINVESLDEIDLLNQVALQTGQPATVAVRVNPDVDAETHGKIATGRKQDKFGLSVADTQEAFRRIAGMPALQAVGLAVHIGSQILSDGPFARAFTAVAEIYRSLQAAGVPLRRLDLGGGLGVPYRPDQAEPNWTAYAQTVRQATAGLDCAVTLEPGRSLVASAGLLLTRVIRRKLTEDRRFLIVDAGMNDLIRPAMYEAWHTILPVTEAPAGTETILTDIVGPVCESSDIFAALRPLPAVEADGLLAILTAGAYGSVMASTYNSRPLVPEVLVDGERHAVVRRRQSVAEQMALESVPDWI
jgi:diaminopimelate decarboxylase